MTDHVPVHPASPWTASPDHRAWLGDEASRLLAFGAAAAVPAAAGGGAAYLDDDGQPDPAQGIQTWITCRTVHSFALGHLLGIPGCAPVAEAAIAGLLTGPLRDAEHGGWFESAGPDGTADRAAGKGCYAHAFVMLAGASATMAGIDGGVGLLEEATRVYLERFWDDDAGAPRDTWDTAFTVCDEYRGLNPTMHSVEAMLAVADAVEVLGRLDEATAWRARAARAAGMVIRLAEENDGRLPEHFDSAWVADLDLNRDRPADPFKPYGATVGHGMEWARLLLGVEAAGGQDADPRLVPTARALFERAVTDGWAVDGAHGFVYTTDWAGVPVVRARMHWVVAEAISTAAALHARTGEPRYAAWYARWWDYAERHLIDRERGSWHHELDEHNTPSASTWSGKPDIYHALQATLIPRLPVGTSVARGLREGRLG